MSAFNLIIATPEKNFYEGEAQSVVISTLDGQIGVLSGHMPLATALTTAPVRIQETSGEWREAALTEGFVEITGDRVVILADTAEWPEDIDAARALDAKNRAEERMMERQSEVEYVRSQVALQRALTRLTVSKEQKK